MTQREVLNAFEALPAGERLIVAKKIQLKMADVLFEELDAELPDVTLSVEEIQKEIKAYRNAKKKKNQDRS
ncbi:hypothetical protein GCM10027275_55180 [Rhabdobacter roseus]|uniref:Uncharacterized protein n=1 Tax=Rhabdobacter roseus TaxID=1655419 RepID=A0A840U1W3_9BACT|nr:hypothetical protein [Rhabdobacter roseus]MBB5287583.1 hypothetical protein [Rhabdobacter roseus]